MLSEPEAVADAGIDAAALKPTECDVGDVGDLPFDLVTVDWEGPEHLPDPASLSALARRVDVRVTAPVRADGFDPLGDDRLYDRLPDAVDLVLVAGHPAYLSPAEEARAIAPRLGAATGRVEDPWVGTEGIERIALATGATQFALLSPTTESDLRALRAAGFEGELAVYAPTVLSADADAVLDAVGDYVARRGPVRQRLPRDGPTGRRAAGRIREVLLDAVPRYAITGDLETVGERVDGLAAAGADYVVAYPARGLSAFGAGADAEN